MNYLKLIKTKYFKKLKKIKKIDGKVYFGFFIIFFIFSFQTKEKETPIEIQKKFDTFIPQGYVLIPIDIVNSEIIEPMLGNYGVVNLYSFSPYTQKPSKMIAKSIKIIQSPKKNGHYAILVPDKKAKTILSYTQPFFAAIKNPEEKESLFEQKQVKRKRNVEVENE